MELMKMNIAYAMGEGIAPQDTPRNNHDLHFWLEDKDGNIIDPTPVVNNRTQKRHYRPFKFGQKAVLKYYMKRYNKQKKEDKKVITDFLYEFPQDRNCASNCIAYWLKHKDCKIVVGSMGFELSKGRVFWEFG